MAKRSRLLLPALILALPLSLAPPARAASTPADKAVATVLFNDACPKFEESQRIDPTPGTLLNLGDCYERSTPPRTASAWGTFKRAEVMARNARYGPAGLCDEAHAGPRTEALQSPDTCRARCPCAGARREMGWETDR